MLQWIMAALADQGYRLADDQHPPTQLLIFGWGMLQGGPGRPALKFIGGDKVDLMWEYQHYGGMTDPRVLLRGIQRVGITGKIWDVAEHDLFLGIVRSYTMDSLEGPKTTLLWETRFACPSTGLAMDNAMRLMVLAAAPNFGRETKLPVNLNASAEFEGRVDVGELRVLDVYAPPAEKDEAAGEPPAAPAR